jgi:protease I
MQSTSGSKGLAVVLVEDTYECLEFHYPRLRLEEAGYTVKSVGPEKKVYQSKEGYWGVADATWKEINPAEVKVLIVPGGFCTDRLRRHPECNKFVHDATEAGAVVGFICHGAWVPISAKIVRGKKVTSHPAVQDDLVNAGAEWVNESCVVDGKLVTAQLPKDLPAFMKAILNILESS